jgi:hypothetical protein
MRCPSDDEARYDVPDSEQSAGGLIKVAQGQLSCQTNVTTLSFSIFFCFSKIAMG